MNDSMSLNVGDGYLLWANAYIWPYLSLSIFPQNDNSLSLTILLVQSMDVQRPSTTNDCNL